MIQACNIADIEFLVDVSPIVTDHHIAKVGGLSNFLIIST